MNFQKLGASLSGASKRGFTTAAKYASAKAAKHWNWKTKAVMFTAGSGIVYQVVDHQLHPRPKNEVVEDLMLSQPASQRKERIVVLGSGWGAVSFLNQLDPFKYDIVCISPRNHFVMTPLLPSVTVGTIESRTVVESIRSICPHATFVEAECTGLDPQAKTLSFKKSTRQSSSREIKDGARTRPEFTMAYDKVVVAVGAENNTFNTPGVNEHAHFLKEMKDARRIRSAIIDAFESAANPAQSPEERKRLLNFVVVGGGPTGVEYAAELADLLHEDLRESFPTLKDQVNIQLVEATEKMLGMFDKEVSTATAKNFKNEGIEFLGNTFVKEVKQHEIVIQRKGNKNLESLPASVVVWATGIKCRPITNKFREAIGLETQNNFRALVTDDHLQVLGAEGVYALGDCATINKAPLPATAQVAAQEGKYLARHLNAVETEYSEKSLLNAMRRQYWSATGMLTREPFQYNHKGSLAYIGGDHAAADFKNAFGGLAEQTGIPVMTGKLTNYLWKGFYFSEQMSVRTKALLAFDWVKAKTFGRDFSRY
mmetsp:Transcript_63029/g.131003  ORF Transcript_63029/g.131003 Transcript_63029/m.131003 type:complete len:540 (-) Transcript_63029:369-1988(-)